MAHFIHDEKNNRIEGLSKEEIYALLALAIQQGELPSVDADTAFVTMFKSIVDGKAYKMAFCTQAQYNELEAQGELVADALYNITDDTSYDDLETLIEQLRTDLTAMETDIQNYKDEIDEHIQTGLRLAVNNIQCSLDFTQWEINRIAYFEAGTEINRINLVNNSSYGNNQVNILPTGTTNAITVAKVNILAGDADIQYELNTINANNNYITFTARNTSNKTIYTPNSSTSGLIDKAITFQIYVKDIYNNEYTIPFTINYKIAP